MIIAVHSFFKVKGVLPSPCYEVHSKFMNMLLVLELSSCPSPVGKVCPTLLRFCQEPRFQDFRFSEVISDLGCQSETQQSCLNFRGGSLSTFWAHVHVRLQYSEQLPRLTLNWVVEVSVKV